MPVSPAVSGAMRSRTMAAAALVTTLGGAVVALSADPTVAAWLQQTLTPRAYGLTMLGVGVLQAVLRWLTTQPLDQRGTDSQ